MILTILYLPEYSYSLEFFYLDGKTFELQEVDMGKNLGCKPGRFTAVVLRDSEKEKILWSTPTLEEAKKTGFIRANVILRLKEIRFHMYGKCQI